MLFRQPWLGAALLAILGMTGQGPGDHGQPEPVSRPNIVIILADDLGYGDVGVTGAPDIVTSNLDALAAEGVRFTNAYANAPVCSPTRAALLSGQYQQRTGVDRVIYVREREVGLPRDVKLLSQYLAEAGYATGIFGKWHLGYPKEHFPTRFGFDAFKGFVAGNVDYFTHNDRLGHHDLWNGEEEIHDSRYMTRLIADEAIHFIDRHSRGPFFLYLPFSAPHDPFQGPGDASTAGNEEITRKKNRTRQVYKTMVEALDQQIGRVVAHIKNKDLDERTAVFFLSDNGGLPGVARNAPFSGFKTTLREGGIRTPLIARFPNRFATGTTSDVPVIAMDLFPTALDLANVTMSSDRIVDGVSLLAVLESKAAALRRRALYFRYQDPRDAEAQRAMVEDGWKYLRAANGDEYLFHLAEDPTEKNDLKREQRERFDRMKRAWAAWAADVASDAHEALPP